MVGLVLVSHSRPLATAVRDLVACISNSRVPIAIAAGTGPDRAEFGTDATEILDGIKTVMSKDGVLVLMDIGSAILSAETAVEFLDEALREKVCLCAAPFVEGAVAAGVLASTGSDLKEVREEAERTLRRKVQHFESPAGRSGAAQPVEEAFGDDDVATTVVAVNNRHGLHARPAAVFIREAARHRCEISVRNRSNGKGPASARSMSELASIEVLQGHEIELAAEGPDAQTALIALKAEIEAGLGETLASTAVSASTMAPTSDSPSPGANPVPVSGGMAIGPVFFAETGDAEVPSHRVSDIEKEKNRLRKAIESAKAALAGDQLPLRLLLGKEEAEIFRAQSLVLDDPALLQAAEKAIQDDHENAALAWQRCCEAAAETYERLSDEYMQQRAADVRDMGHRVLEALGVQRRQMPNPSQPGILIAEDLTPADITGLPGETVLGVICMQGGRTSHAGILLRALGIPAIAQAKSFFERERIDPSNSEVIAAFDGDSGEIWLNPSQAEMQRLRARKQSLDREMERITRLSHERAKTLDGHTIDVLANLGNSAEAANALNLGAEGVGLFRTEFLFMNRNDLPDEAEQFEAFRTLRVVMDKRPVVIRTLDIGGDKAAPGLGLAREENPFLGLRAIRLCLKRRELFRIHLRAILRAAHGGNFRIMFPMISDLGELREAKTELENVRAMLESENKTHVWPIPVGIMVEVPSAALLIEQLAPLVDFFSIGTNDLTQYVLAADRSHPELTQFQDPLHPSVLRLISKVAAVAHAHGRHVGVCGEAASDPVTAGLLVGLGIDELSLAPALIPKIKETIRNVSRHEMEILATDAQSLGTAAEARALVGAAS